MFDSGSDQEPAAAQADADQAWAWPGAPAAAPGPVAADPAADALVQAVDGLLAQDLPSLSGPVALERCRTVLAQAERLGVAACDALRDVQARELWADDTAGSMAGWLRQQPCGDAGRTTRSARLATRTKVRDAVLDSLIGLGTADLLTKALDDLPESSEPGQVEGVLTGAVPDLLTRWTARNCLDPAADPVADARAAQVRQVIDDALADSAAAPAQRLEAAYVLIGQAVSPSALASQLQLLADALAPECLGDREDACHEGRRLVLTKKRLEPGYRLRGELTDEVGAALRAQLDARAAARARAAETLRTAAEDQTDDVALFGTAGPGTPPCDSDPPDQEDRSEDGEAAAVLDGPPRLTDDQLAHDLLGELIGAAAEAREPGTPNPTPISLTCSLDQLEGRLGALPGTLLLPDGPFGISRDALRRHGCDGRLSAVLLDAARTPIGASGTHRNATERERRALRAMWGDYCAVNACGSTDTVPHHVDPWWRCGVTRLENLVPVCKGNHHDVHDGHRTLRLRDGRLIDENGWVDPPAPPPPEADPTP